MPALTRRRAAGLALAVALATAGSAQAATRSDVVLVQLTPGATGVGVAQALDATSSVGLAGGWRAYRLDTPVTLTQAREDLASTTADRRVVLDSPVRAVAAVDDPLFGAQWALQNTGQSAAGQPGVPGADIDAVGAWAAAGSLAPVTVAVVDNGVDFNHPDLSGAAWTNPDPALPGTHGWDYVTGGAATTHPGGHGTHVAGIIAATGGNGTGIAGVAPNARIMSVRFLDDSGTGYTSDAMRAIDWAWRNGATVINASFGGGGNAICSSVDAAVAHGAVVVAAAGNDAVDVDGNPMYPAACPSAGLISVAATDNRDGLAWFSNTGAVGVDLGAPGLSIRSTVPGGYADKSGTSMATPQVTGVAALLRGADPTADVGRVRQAVLTGAEPVAALSGRTVTGARLDALGSLLALRGTPTGDVTAPTAPVPLTPTGGQLVGVTTPTVGWSEAADPESGIARYEVWVDGTRVLADVPSQATQATLPAVSEGAHSWWVVAVNGEGLTTASAGAEFVTHALRPAVLTSPAPGAAVTGPAVEFRWTGWTGVTAQHTLLVDGVPLEAGAADRVSVGELAAGAHTWSVRSTDGAGRSVTSGVRTVFVVIPAVPAVPVTAPAVPIAKPLPVARACPRGTVRRRVRVGRTWRVRCVRTPVARSRSRVVVRPVSR